MMSNLLYPKDYINNVLIGEIRDIMNHGHAYLSFSLMCSGIEYLGICLDDGSGWLDDYKSKRHFIGALSQLFPMHYQSLSKPLYKKLRCGMLHAQLPNGYSLTEQKHGPFAYSDHLITNNHLIVVEHFFRDFETACNKVIATAFPTTSKMNEPFLSIP